MQGLGGLVQRMAPGGCCIHTQLGWGPAAAAAAAVAARHRRSVRTQAKRPQKVPTGLLLLYAEFGQPMLQGMRTVWVHSW
jgi:hypothetical protein